MTDDAVVQAAIERVMAVAISIASGQPPDLCEEYVSDDFPMTVGDLRAAVCGRYYVEDGYWVKIPKAARP